MAPDLKATFVPSGFDDYYMPEVVAPSPQRVTPQVPQNMQDGLQRLELEANHTDRQPKSHHEREPSLSTYMSGTQNPASNSTAPAIESADVRAYKQPKPSLGVNSVAMPRDSPSFSPFPKITGDNVPPTDDEKEGILLNAKKHVLHSQNVSMQIIWARDVLIWADISMEAAIRDATTYDHPRAATPRIEHELRADALNIVDYLSQQEHPEALYMRSKWLEFGKFGHRIDKREAYSGYKRAAELGHARSEYRIGMLYEQSNDMSKAKEHYYRGMSLKDSAALYRMGMMSLLGQHGEQKDYATGVERIRMAADTSDEDAPQGAYVYGMLVGRDLPDITTPEGLLPHNLETAKMYVEKAAYMGFAKAQLKMGQAYELCQLACEFSPSFSLHYYGLAAKQGQPEAALGVSRWFLFGYEGLFKKNEELAYQYANDAAAAKLATGAFAMGYYNEIGIHVPKSLAEAKKWYQVAADQGNKDAIARLDSLGQDKTLSKQDHETTTLTRIKSQHGSQRGQRPERFRKPQVMLAVDERSGLSTHMNDGPLPPPKPLAANTLPPLPDERDNAPHSSATLPMRPQSAAPYPEDDRPQPLRPNRPKSTVPYPEDDVRAPATPQHGPPGGRLPYGLQADRPGSAFGIKTQQPQGAPRPMMSQSQSMNNLNVPGGPDPRMKPVSGGWEGQGRGGWQPSPGPGRPHPADGGYGRPTSLQPSSGGSPGPSLGRGQRPVSNVYPPGPGAGGPRPHSAIPPAGMDFGRGDYGGGRGRPVSDLPPTGPHDPRLGRVPVGGGPPSVATSALGHSGRHTSVPMASSVGPAVGRVGTAPPAQFARPSESPRPSPVPSVASAPAKPSKGPATFEDMGIPQGKQDGDCVIM